MEKLQPEWLKPVWELDSWTYDVTVLLSYEKDQRPDDLAADSSPAAEDDERTVRRTRRGDTNMVLLREGAALSALCGVETPSDGRAGDQWSRRDVALAVALTRMTAFIPFRGVRAGGTENELASDNRVPGGQHHHHNNSGTERPFRTPFSLVFNNRAEEAFYFMTITMLDFASRFSGGASRSDPSPSAPVDGWVKACGALGNIDLLHKCADVALADLRAQNGSKQEIISEANWFFNTYIVGACLSDNGAAIDLLLRFPPPGMAEHVANYFHLSRADCPVTIEGTKSSSSLLWIDQVMCRVQPEETGPDTMWESEFQRTLLDQENDEWEIDGGKGATTTTTTATAPTTAAVATTAQGEASIARERMSSVHARFVANIVNKKEYGENGFMNFPKPDIAYTVSNLARRVKRGLGAIYDNGTRMTREDLSILRVELIPEDTSAWISLGFSMSHNSVVHVDLGSGVKKKFTHTEVTVRALEMQIKLSEGNPKEDESCAWTNMSCDCDLFAPLPDGTPATIVIAGKPYTQNDCAQKALHVSLLKRTFDRTSPLWDNVGSFLKPSAPGAPVSTETHFTDVREGGRSFSSLECITVALGIRPMASHWHWHSAGRALWQHEVSGALPADALTISLPSTIVESSSLLPVLERVLGLVGKTFKDVKEEQRSMNESVVVVGTGGKVAPTGGPCPYIVRLNELECYLVNYLSEPADMLTHVASDDSAEAFRRLIKVLTPERISEKGRRVIETQVDGIGSFEKFCSTL